MNIGHIKISQPSLLAPMAGVTDRPFRSLCRQFGAGLVVSEMISANPLLRETRKTQLRMNHDGEMAPIAVQIAGADADLLAECAQYNVDHGAEIIDINMGCPAKKVCKKAAGSALLRDEPLVAKLLKAVVEAVDVPVTLKIRIGWDEQNKNGVKIAKMAEDIGIQAITVHGRTRACGFAGHVDYDTIAAIKQSVGIPVIANGDIDTPQMAKKVLAHTGADAVMVARGAQGKPWIFNQINHLLLHGELLPEPDKLSIIDIFNTHMRSLCEFYDEFQGVRMARKHVGWFAKTKSDGRAFLHHFHQQDTLEQQITCFNQWLNTVE